MRLRRAPQRGAGRCLAAVRVRPGGEWDRSGPGVGPFWATLGAGGAGVRVVGGLNRWCRWVLVVPVLPVGALALVATEKPRLVGRGLWCLGGLGFSRVLSVCWWWVVALVGAADDKQQCPADKGECNHCAND